MQLQHHIIYMFWKIKSYVNFLYQIYWEKFFRYFVQSFSWAWKFSVYMFCVNF